VLVAAKNKKRVTEMAELPSFARPVPSLIDCASDVNMPHASLLPISTLYPADDTGDSCAKLQGFSSPKAQLRWTDPNLETITSFTTLEINSNEAEQAQEVPRLYKPGTNLSSVTCESMSEDCLTSALHSFPVSHTDSTPSLALKKMARLSQENIQSIGSLTSRETLGMHCNALNSLAHTLDALQAFKLDSSRHHWETANTSFGEAVATAPHVSLWASEYWPFKNVPFNTDANVANGFALLPSWNSSRVFIHKRWWSPRSRAARKVELVDEAIDRAMILVDKQTAMLECLRTSIDAFASVSSLPDWQILKSKTLELE
jgi:hypothetical protein